MNVTAYLVLKGKPNRYRGGQIDSATIARVTSKKPTSLGKYEQMVELRLELDDGFFDDVIPLLDLTVGKTVRPVVKGTATVRKRVRKQP